MPLFNFPNTTTEGLDTIAINTTAQVPNFVPGLLVFVFFFVFLAGSKLQKSRIGTADYAAWSVVASIFMLVSALVLSVIQGFIRLDWLGICFAVTLGCGVWLFLDRKFSEG